MKLIIIILIVSMLVIAGCVDNTSAIKHCNSLGLDWTGDKFGCDVMCINVSTQQLYRYAADCKIIRR